MTKPAATPSVAERRAIPFKSVWHSGEEIRASMRSGGKGHGTSTSHLINAAEQTTYHRLPTLHTRNLPPQHPRQRYTTPLINTTPFPAPALPLTPLPPTTKSSSMQPPHMKLPHITGARSWMVTSSLPAFPSWKQLCLATTPATMILVLIAMSFMTGQRSRPTLPSTLFASRASVMTWQRSPLVVAPSVCKADLETRRVLSQNFWMKGERSCGWTGKQGSLRWAHYWGSWRQGRPSCQGIER